MSSSQARRRRRLSASLIVGLFAGLGALSVLAGAAQPTFYPDDPIQVDDDRAFDASAASIRAVVARARYSEDGAADYIAAVLIGRRDKVLKAWLTGVNPIVDAALNPSGVLTFANAAVDARVATPPGSYVLDWSRFDNALGTSARVGDEVSVTAPRAEAPRALLERSAFIAVTIRSLHPAYPQWGHPVTVYFRRTASGWQTVGLDRTPAR